MTIAAIVYIAKKFETNDALKMSVFVESVSIWITCIFFTLVSLILGC